LQQPRTLRQPTVASLSPAATDILLGIGAGDHLAAVSNYDAGRAEIAGLPRVGDYRTQDWEKLASLRPAKMIIQLHPDRTPAGLRERAAGQGIDLVNIQIDNLDDVFAAIPRIADAAGEREKGDAALKTLREKFDTVRARVAGRPKVRTLVVVDVGGRSVAGPGTFLHDILTAAGGDNAAAGLGNPWPTVDREKIAQMRPQAVIHLLPEASPQTKAQAEQFWAAMPDLPAVKNRKVHYLTDWFVMLPGYHLGDLAEQFAMVLHPFANVGPLNQLAPSTTDPPPVRPLQREGPPATGELPDSSQPSR
jgi:iron complex transport system substrate-binding protein